MSRTFRCLWAGIADGSGPREVRFGPRGPAGAAGPGVAAGGATGEVLAKASNTDYDTEWVAQSGGGGAWGTITGTLADQTDLQTALDLKAALASPTFTGTPAAPTAAPGTNTTQLATTAFVAAAAAAITGGTLAQFAATTSAQLRGLLSDETGTGAAYFQGGDLGTPAAGVLTNCTGYPAAGTSGQLQWNSGGAFAGTTGITYATTGTHLTFAAGAAVKAMVVNVDPSSTVNVVEVARTSGTTGRFVIDNAVRCGFGTASPNSASVLTVSSATGLTTALRLEVLNAGEFLLKAGGNGIVSVDASGVTGGRWVLLDNGNVGYGVPAPATRLDIDGVFTLSANSSTGTKRAQAAVTPAWVTSTDASRAGRLTLGAYSTTTLQEGVRIDGDSGGVKLGFYATAAVAKQTVTGSRGGNAALADLLTKLATLGLITDSTSA